MPQKKLPKPKEIPSVSQASKPAFVKSIGISFTPESEKVVTEAYNLFPLYTEFDGIRIYRDKMTLTEFCRIMLLSKCHEFINQQKKEG